MALIGEAAFGGDGGKRPLRVSEQLASSAQLQPLLVLSRRLLFETAKRSREVNGMHSGFASEIAHPQPV
jgi:hypothetical protein